MPVLPGQLTAGAAPHCSVMTTWFSIRVTPASSSVTTSRRTPPVIAMMAANLGHFGTDLYVWSGWEFSFIEVADGLAGTSSIMPQKKNPHALERVKAVGGQAIGWLATIMGSQRSALSTDLDYAFGDDLFGEYARASYASIRLMDEVIGTLIVQQGAHGVHRGRVLEHDKPSGRRVGPAARHAVSCRAPDRRALRARRGQRRVRRRARSAASLSSTPRRDIAGITLAMSDTDLRDLLDARLLHRDAGF